VRGGFVKVLEDDAPRSLCGRWAEGVAHNLRALPRTVEGRHARPDSEIAVRRGVARAAAWAIVGRIVPNRPVRSRPMRTTSDGSPGATALTPQRAGLGQSPTSTRETERPRATFSIRHEHRSRFADRAGQFEAAYAALLR